MGARALTIIIVPPRRPWSVGTRVVRNDHTLQGGHKKKKNKNATTRVKRVDARQNFGLSIVVKRNLKREKLLRECSTRPSQEQYSADNRTRAGFYRLGRNRSNIRCYS